MRWNKCDKVWGNTNSLFKWCFLSCHLCCCLNSLMWYKWEPGIVNSNCNHLLILRQLTELLRKVYNHSIATNIFFLLPKGDKSRCWSPTIRRHNQVPICQPHGLQISQMAGQTRLLPVRVCNVDCTFTPAQFFYM